MSIMNHRTPAFLLAVSMLLVACGPGAVDNAATTIDSETTTTMTTTTTVTTTTAGNGASDGASAAEVVMQQTSFSPTELTVAVGSAVTWTNEDTITHTTESNDGLWNSGTLSPVGTFSFTFEDPGTYKYFCSIHPASMQATVIVNG